MQTEKAAIKKAEGAHMKELESERLSEIEVREKEKKGEQEGRTEKATNLIAEPGANLPAENEVKNVEVEASALMKNLECVEVQLAGGSSR